MNIIDKKQPRNVGIAISGGARNALKIGFTVSALKQNHPKSRVYLFSEDKIPYEVRKILDFDGFGVIKNEFWFKLFLKFKRIEKLIDLTKEKSLQLAALKYIKIDIINQKIKMKTQSYMNNQNALLDLGLAPHQYTVFYNGYRYLEKIEFQNKKWPYEKEFLIHFLKVNPTDKILYLYDDQKSPVQDLRIVTSKVEDLEKCVVFLEKSNGFVGTDSLIALISSQLGIPTTVLTGPTTFEEVWGTKLTVLKANLPCAPCEFDFECRDNVCMKTFSPQLVLQKLNELQK
jgi:hypothetical protein